MACCRIRQVLTTGRLPLSFRGRLHEWTAAARISRTGQPFAKRHSGNYLAETEPNWRTDCRTCKPISDLTVFYRLRRLERQLLAVSPLTELDVRETNERVSRHVKQRSWQYKCMTFSSIVKKGYTILLKMWYVGHRPFSNISYFHDDTNLIEEGRI